MSCVCLTPAVCRRAPNRTACDVLRSYSAVGRDRHSCILKGHAVIGIRRFTSGTSLIYGDPDRERGNAGTELAARRGGHFAQSYWPCRVFHGEYAGAEMWKPHCGLSGLSSCDSRSCAFHVGRACALYAGVERFRSIGDLTGSDLWPVKSCITARQQAEPAQPAAASGSRTAATRVHGKPRPALIYGRTGRAVYRCYLFALSET